MIPMQMQFVRNGTEEHHHEQCTSHTDGREDENQDHFWMTAPEGPNRNERKSGKVELQRDGNGRQCRNLRHKSWIDPQLLHARDERRAFESEASRCAVGAANTPA